MPGAAFERSPSLDQVGAKDSPSLEEGEIPYLGDSNAEQRKEKRPRAEEPKEERPPAEESKAEKEDGGK